MAKDPSPLAVTSRSFSKHPVLRQELAEKYANITFNDDGASLKDAELVKFLRSHSHAIVALERIDAAILDQLPELKVVSKYGVGIDNLDLRAMHDRGIKVGWTPGVNRRSVAELALCFMIAGIRFVITAHHEVQNGLWRQLNGGLLSGKTVGIIGCGHVGKDLIGLLKPFGCRVLVNDVVDVAEFCGKAGAEVSSLDKLLAESDVVSIHVPLNSGTRGWFGKEMLAKMKPGSVLINTARGQMVDELALKDSLQSGHLAAAAFDVLGVEPPTDRGLIELPNFFVTPHIGGSATEAVLAMGRAAISGLSEARDASQFFSYVD